MPRKARIDAPGALHHIMCRGIERRKIFRDETDRDNFVKRLKRVITETQTPCYAWALIPNHFHLLLKTGQVPIATVMRKLLTGYAVTFNRRHGRAGYLFQNRYKSILCQEDAYFLELIRYIHLNPLRSGLVHSMKELDRFPYSGHSVLMGKRMHEWQDLNYVLRVVRQTSVDRTPELSSIHGKRCRTGQTAGSDRWRADQKRWRLEGAQVIPPTKHSRQRG